MGNRSIAELLTAADELAKSRLSERRYAHTIRVADTAEHLAKTHNLDPERTRLAALIHDAAREMKKDKYLRVAEEWNIPYGDFERENPKLLHGPVAAELSRRELGVEDGEILDAVREHTVGRAEMGDISLALYLADKIEPERDYPSVEKIREMAENDLRAATTEALRTAIAFGEMRGKTVHPASREALNWLDESDGRPNEGME
ncbi:MAG: bis(5'-nucleosyl)-tetraphosphatase (symmetrical) YqeK [Rubrobacteraceae bacterium]|jgi:predicted HD superfamily hydrolase involved in NAD metabolism|nr:bis(5'-nucleosyl)-tetraphosphatase (symmetrical) YqeK [Rubrobacter sp.]